MNKWQKFLQVLVAGIMLVALCGASPAVSPAMAATRAQPQLLQMAAAQPAARLSVIVQKADKTDQAERLVASLGGVVTQDLRIINAFAAELTAGAAQRLAASPAVRWVSLDAPMTASGGPDGTVNTASLLSVYDKAIGADKVWAMGYQGSSIAVAVVDSGINPSGDLFTDLGVNRQIADVRFNTDYNQNTSDGYGHGTHVSSVVGGDGSDSGGKYVGVAPKVNLINVKVSNDDGSARIQDVVAGLQWVLDNKAKYNIRVVNLSLNSSVAESYHTSPLDAAVEILWFNKIVVVASAGNQGNGAIYPPANDPFIITVGATDDKGTSSISDDSLASFSAYGPTSDAIAKPDLVAPGKNIIARLVNANMGLAQAHPANKVDGGVYFRMSGTSMAAPMVSGAAALLLQASPNLTPDQVKYRLKATANKSWAGYNATKAGAGYLDINAAVKGTTTKSANTGLAVSHLLTTGPDGVLGPTVSWSSVSWSSVSWSSVSWSSVSWSSVSWSSVSWSSDYWAP